MATLKETYGSMEPKSLKDQYGPMLPENAANYPQTAMAQMSGKPYGFADLSVPESVKFKQRGLDAGRSLVTEPPIPQPDATGVGPMSVLPQKQPEYDMGGITELLKRQPIDRTPIPEPAQSTLVTPVDPRWQQPKEPMHLVPQPTRGVIFNAIANPNSPFWDLTPEMQDMVAKSQENRRVPYTPADPKDMARLQTALNYIKSGGMPYDPYGPASGIAVNLARGFIGKPTLDVQGSSGLVNMLANFGGEGAKYGLLMSAGAGLGLPAVAAGAGSGAVSGIARELVSDEPFDPANIATETLLGGAGEAAFLGGKLGLNKLGAARRVKARGGARPIDTGGLIPKPEEVQTESLTRIYGGKSELGTPGSTRWEGLTRTNKPKGKIDAVQERKTAEVSLAEQAGGGGGVRKAQQTKPAEIPAEQKAPQEKVKEPMTQIIGWPAYQAVQHAAENARAAYDYASAYGYPAKEAAAMRTADEALAAARVQYPLAAAYARAESYSMAANDQKASAGRKAMTAIESGADATATIQAMESDWLAAAERSVDEVRYATTARAVEGKSVPPEVLKDYPDLAARVKAPAQEVKQALPTIRKVGPVKPPVEPAAVAEPDGVALNKKKIAQYRQELGYDKFDQQAKKSFDRTTTEAIERNLPENAIDNAREVIGSRRPIDEAEHAAMVMKYVDLRNEHRSLMTDLATAREKGARITDLLAKQRNLESWMNTLLEGSELASTTTARTLNIRKMMLEKIGDDFQLVNIKRDATNIKGRRLTPKESRLFESQSAKLEVLQKQIADAETRHAKILGDNEKTLAEIQVQREAKKQRITVKSGESVAKIKAERADVKKQLMGMGFRVNEATGLAPEAAYLVGKLAKTYIQEGVTGISALTKKVMSDIPDLAERDVIESLNARSPQMQARAKTAAEKAVSALQTEARLMTQIEDQANGIFKAPVKRQPPLARIKSLSTIRSMQRSVNKIRMQAYDSGVNPDQIEKVVYKANLADDALHRFKLQVQAGENISADQIVEFKESLNLLRRELNTHTDIKNSQSQLAKLLKQIENREYIVPDVVKPKLLPPDLEKLIVTRNALRREIMDAQFRLAPITLSTTIGEAVNIPRTLMATADMSGVLRQGLALSVRGVWDKSRRDVFTRANAKSYKAFFSKYTAEQVDNYIRSADDFWQIEKAGLFLATLGKGKLLRHEEYFMSNFLTSPFMKKLGYGYVVEASERHMVTHLNLLRVGVFNDFRRRFPNATAEELKAYAHYINVATGRGDTLATAKAANVLSAFFFAPRFAVSRLQAPLMMFRYWKLPRVRKEIAKDMASLAITGNAVLALAQMAGAEVAYDPRSSDFGKIKVGNTRYDIWGGFQQPLRLIAQIPAAGGERVGAWRKLKKSQQVDPVVSMGRFLSYKLSPAITISHDLLTGKNMIGQKVTPTEVGLRAIFPLFVQDVRDAFEDAGFGPAAGVGAAAFFGIGANTYKKKK